MKSGNRWALTLWLALAASSSLTAPSLAQKGETAALGARTNELSRAGKYSEALSLAQAQLESLEKKYGSFHRDVAGALTAQLKLNADWVVLSACNTIAGDKPGAEALSGLARSFSYAGARALLISHWAVDSEAATRLTTSTFDRLKADRNLGRAEALRQAMLAYLGDDSRRPKMHTRHFGDHSP
jgi:hypothetical protein